MTTRRAFTLIEIIVVIAIILILAAIIFPVSTRAIRQARIAEGWSNLRQSAVAVAIYVSDYDQQVPVSPIVAKDIIPAEVQCHPLDKWEPECKSRQNPYMVGSWGYIPTHPLTEKFNFDQCLLANVFAAKSPIEYSEDYNGGDLGPPLVWYPDRVEFIGLDGSLRVQRSPYRDQESTGTGAVFAWRNLFGSCPYITEQIDIEEN